MESMERFNLTVAPQDAVFPVTAQIYATSIMWVVVAVFVGVCLYQAWKTRSLLAVQLVLGGMICYLNEPIVDILTLVWHPRPNQWVALETYGPVPLWGLGIYTIFFGAMTYLTLMEARRGITRRAFWISVGFFFIADVACEWPLIYNGLYIYYGDPPYVVLGLPLYWLFINTIGPLIAVALLLRAPQMFSGWRQVLIPLLPMTTDAAGSVICGWPIMSALNTPNASTELKWAAATLTILLGLVVMDGLSRLICVEQNAEARLAARTPRVSATPKGNAI